jgi:DNA-binding NtrC family response regulator
VGGNEPIEVDVRIIAATNKDLRKAVAEGAFREDLFYRLNVIPVTLPPLRERKEDIPILVEHFLDRLEAELKRRVEVSPEGMAALLAHDWPGNVRELRNVLERGAVVAKGDLIKPADLGLAPAPARVPGTNAPGEPATLEDVEKKHISEVLAHTGGNVSQAARLLNIDRVTLYNKIRKFGLRRGEEADPAGG